jgi:hypothetical protein
VVFVNGEIIRAIVSKMDNFWTLDTPLAENIWYKRETHKVTNDYSRM